MGIKAWRPLNQIEKDKYLYHYTSMEKAFSILYSNELWFSNINDTNDVFEQKVKISFSEIKNNCKTHKDYKDALDKINIVRNYMDDVREKIKLLCFSRDTELRTDEDIRTFKELMSSLPPEHQTINVIGRGFSLPRMWSQYASDNKGVCFIFNKNQILEKVSNSNHFYMAENVIYKPLYSPYMIPIKEFEKTYEYITTEYDDAIKTMLKKNLPYLRCDFFSKLSDWSSENEFRIILTNNHGENTVKLKHIDNAIEGIVFGANTEPVYSDLLKYAARNFDLRKIVYEDIITKISSEI